MTQNSKRSTRVHRLPMSRPDDTSQIRALIADGTIDPSNIVAILGKTEGNGCVNDWTRGYAVQSLQLALSETLDADQIKRICMVMSGGTEGGLSPHWIVFEVINDPHEQQDGPALAIGSHITRPLDPSEIGRVEQVLLVADGVRTAMAEAGIDDPGQVHFVQIKCPLLTLERIAEAERSGTVATGDTLKSMGMSRGASALGVAVALGELAPDQINNSVICNDWSLYSTRASCSAGVELMECEILVMGMGDGWAGPLHIGHGLMQDAIDSQAIAETFISLDLGPSALLSNAERNRVAAVLVKAEAAHSGTIRGARHTMLDDSDISSTRHARGFVAGVLAGMTGQTALFVSGGAEHQGPDGGGPCAIICQSSGPI